MGGDGGGEAGGEEPGGRVVYVGHVPHGFYEKQMLGYFTQFGEVLRVKLSRSKKTGRSKGYAFLEFQDPEVATIAAEAMDGYFLSKNKLVCHVVAPEKLHPKTFAGANRRFKKIPWQQLARKRHNKARTPAETDKLLRKLGAKEAKRKRKIEEAGIEYEFPEGVREKVAALKQKGATGPGEGKKGAKKKTRVKELEASESESEEAPAPPPPKKRKAAAERKPKKEKTPKKKGEDKGAKKAAKKEKKALPTRSPKTRAEKAKAGRKVP